MLTYINPNASPPPRITLSANLATHTMHWSNFS